MRLLLILLIAFAALRPAWGQDFEAAFVTASSGMLENPHDIELSADGKLLYVSDLGNDRVAVLDAQSLKFLNVFGAADLSAPHDVDLGPDGRLYVADTGNDRIAIYTLSGRSGTYAGELKGGIYAPEGVLAHSDGRVYATGSGSDNIVIYADGKLAGEAGNMRYPHDVIAAPDGTLWIADAGNNRMIQMNLGLETLKLLQGAPYDFDGPRYQDTTKDGLLIVADKNSHQVKVIGPDGALIKVLGTGKAEKGPGKFTTPEGVVTRGKDLWLSDSGNDRIVRYRIGD